MFTAILYLICLFYIWSFLTERIFYCLANEYSMAVFYVIICNLQLQQSGRAAADSAEICQKLKGDLLAVFNVLPKDVQQLLLFNPERAALLQRTPELTKPLGTHLWQVGTAPSYTSNIVCMTWLGIWRLQVFSSCYWRMGHFVIRLLHLLSQDWENISYFRNNYTLGEMSSLS